MDLPGRSENRSKFLVLHVATKRQLMLAPYTSNDRPSQSSYITTLVAQAIDHRICKAHSVIHIGTGESQTDPGGGANPGGGPP